MVGSYIIAPLAVGLGQPKYLHQRMYRPASTGEMRCVESEFAIV